MSWSEWKELGDAAKRLYNDCIEVSQLMNGRFNKTSKSMKSKWRAYEAISQLKCDLDDVVCAIRWPDKSNAEVIHVFYGDDRAEPTL